MNGVQFSVEKWSSSPEALIVGLARTGDREAFGELVRRRQSWIRNLMRRLCHDPVLADDLAQQVFLRAWKDIRKLREPAKFAGWLKQLAVNTWRQHARRNDPLKFADDEPGEQANPATAGASSPASTSGIAVDLDRALSKLEGKQKLCVVLSYAEGMSHGEISELTGLPLGTVKSHVRRGAAKLQSLLAGYDESTADAPGEPAGAAALSQGASA